MSPTFHPIRIRRIYEDPNPDDGARILVDRLWSRGISKQRAQLDLWLKEVAPTTELRKWYDHDPSKFEEFSEAYRAELTEGDPAEALDRLREWVKQSPVTLLTASKSEAISHAMVLKAVLEDSQATGTPRD